MERHRPPPPVTTSSSTPFVGGAHRVSDTHNDNRGSAERNVSEESGIIVFGGGNGCAGRGCLFWIVVSVVASVVLTVLANLVFVLF